MSITLLILLLLAVLLSALVTGGMRRYALAHRIVDIPNARSAHASPTPRGGGLAIVLVVFAGLVWMSALGTLAVGLFVALAGGALVVAAIGYLDDRSHVPAGWRLAAHICACAWAIAWVAPLPALPLLPLHVPLGWPGTVMAVFVMVWMLNLYNFMDGLDGIAGVQALTVGSVLAGLFWWSGAVDLATVSTLVAASSLGFLLWNWPPAKIFMGDAGSGFLGFIFAALVVVAFARNALTFWAVLIPLGVFIVDATWTLLRRLSRGEHLYEAHCSHAYQHAAIEGGSHLAVTLGVAAINLLWLAPLAWWALLEPAYGALALLVAWAPLLVLCARFRAGLPG